jgi:hypothetical protein
MLYILQRLLRPLSGAQKLYIQHRVLRETFSATCHCRGREFHLFHDSGRKQKRFDKVPDAVYTVFELLMMGGGTA